LPWFLIQANLAISVQLMWSVRNVPFKTPYFVPFIFACVSSVFALSVALCLALPCASRSPAVGGGQVWIYCANHAVSHCAGRAARPRPTMSDASPMDVDNAPTAPRRSRRVNTVIAAAALLIATFLEQQNFASCFAETAAAPTGFPWVRFLIREQKAKARAKISVNGEQKFYFPKKKRLADYRILEGHF